MTTLHDLMAESIDTRTAALRAADAAPSGATRGLIGRRRRRNVALAGGSSALAVGGMVASGAVPSFKPADASPAASATGSEATTTVIIPLDTGRDNSTYLGWDDIITCGSTIPARSTTTEGFAQSVALDGDHSLGANATSGHVSTTLTYSGPDHPPVFIEAGQVLLVKDHVVVATFDDRGQGDDAPYESLTEGASWTSSASTRLGNALGPVPCAANYPIGAATDTALAAGEYELYVISRAHITEQQVALMSLGDGALVFAAPDSEGHASGPDVCRDGSAVPHPSAPPKIAAAECDPDAAARIAVDDATGLATVTYPAADFVGELNVRLVSTPIPMTVSKDLTWADLGLTWRAHPVRICDAPSGESCVTTVIEDSSTSPSSD